MAQVELLREIVKTLNELGIPYALTGSIASSFYGEPRGTHDIDVVIALSPSDVERFIRSFDPQRFYLDEEAVREALARESVFNLIDVEAGIKVDFWMLKDEPYYRESFRRRIKHRIFGEEMYLLAPEDVILTKLVWHKLTEGSGRQFRDALGVYLAQKGKLDLSYLMRWAERLGVRGLVEEMIEKAGEIEGC
ncbi:hypothetical protein DRP77_05930 [Candidatus Poribacteria bacterium]|nr:MAG: hypothetical protein DRP77_05930 [Candidatus Poribacteria bacterium]